MNPPGLPRDWYRIILSIEGSVSRHAGEAGLSRLDRVRLQCLARSLRTAARLVRALYL